MIDKQQLIQQARIARKKAYCPYSHYMVGAAVLGINGKIYTGCNIENASYGMTICAERTAIFTMVADGCRQYKALAVVGGEEGDGAPCMACRQVMTEFCESMDTPMYHSGPQGEIYEHPIKEICPFPFTAFKENKDYQD